MITLKILLWIFISFSISMLVIESSIFSGIRNFLKSIHPSINKLLSCFMCFGFWSGVILSLFLWSPSTAVFGFTETIPGIHWDKYLLFDGILSSAAVWIIHLLETKLN